MDCYNVSNYFEVIQKNPKQWTYYISSSKIDFHDRKNISRQIVLLNVYYIICVTVLVTLVGMRWSLKPWEASLRKQEYWLYFSSQQSEVQTASVQQWPHQIWAASKAVVELSISFSLHLLLFFLSFSYLFQ